MGFFIRAGLCAVLALSAAALADPPAQSQTKTYEQWVALAEAGDASVDWTALRHAYVQSPSYDGYGSGWDEARGAFLKAVLARDCATALRLAEAILKADFTYPLVHVTLGNCYRTAGDMDKAKIEYAAFNGLMASILASGDGTSVANAYVVVTMSEERFVLMHVNLEETGQSLISKDGHNYDLIDGVNPETGSKKQVYFNVDAMFGSLTRKLGHDKQE